MGEDEDECPAKLSTDSDKTQKLNVFLKWCDDNGFKLSKKVKLWEFLKLQ